MTLLKIKRIDFWIYLIIAFILGILATYSFSSPSSEARGSPINSAPLAFFKKESETKMESKPCTKCKKEKSLNEFNRDKNREDRRSWCKACVSTYNKNWHEKNRELRRPKTRVWKLKREYGITPEDYGYLFKKQNGRCAICSKKQKILCIDHNHKTGELRGLLCQNCNRKLGFIEDKEFLKKALNYLHRFSEESGFFESISNPPNSMSAGAGSPPQPAPTFTDSRSAAALPISPETWAQAGFPARRLVITAYCPKSCCCGEFADGITASGHEIQPGDCFVAAPPEIPFGTKLSIPSYAGGSMVSVLDRGGKIKGNRLDVFFDSHFEALVWGVREFGVK